MGLHDADPVVVQVALPVVYLAKAPRPDVTRAALRRKVLGAEQLGMDPHDEHLLIVRAVVDADPAPRRQEALIAPEEVVVELFRGGLLEAVHLHSLGIDATRHVLDRAVLARR